MNHQVEKNISFLRSIQEELNHQETDAQAHPRFWIIRDARWINCQEGESDTFMLYTPDDDSLRSPMAYMEEVLFDRKESFDPFYLSSLWLIYQMFEAGFHGFRAIEDLLSWAQTHDDDSIEYVYLKKEYYHCPNTLFFTKSEAKEHIKQNGHHYSDDAHTYAMSITCAPKLEKLMEILHSFDWDQIQARELESSETS